MNSYRYIVFGAGRQGLAAIRDLVLNCEAAHVIAVEPDARRKQLAAARLTQMLKKRASCVSFATSVSNADLKRADVVLSCAPYKANVELSARAIAAGVAFCDLGGNPTIVATQEKLARKAKTAVVPDCGISPGLSNILVVHCAKVLGCDTVRVRCGGLPLEPLERSVNPLGYKLVFSAAGLTSEYSGSVPVIVKGKCTKVAALSVVERFEDGLESSPTSNNSPQIVEYLRSIGVRDYDYMTLRYDGHWEQVRGWKALGYLMGDATRDAELARILESDPALRYDPARDADRLLLSVRGTRRGRGLDHGFSYRLDVAADKKTRLTAMELTTGWGITIVAHHMAQGRGVPRGFSTPERFVDTAWVIGELERRLAGLT